MAGRRRPVRRTAEEEQADRETFAWFDRVSDEELAEYEGKWIVQYRGKIVSVRRSEAAAYASIDRAIQVGKLPEDAVPAVEWIPPPDLILLGPRAYYGGRIH